MSMRPLKISKSITTRESESLGKYLLEIGKLNLLSVEEESQLFEEVKMGSKKAMEKLTTSNLRFVVSVAKQYQGQGMPLSDLINEGNIGLMEAVKKFDVTKGFRFISYAVWWIRQFIVRALTEQSQLVRAPYNKKLLDRRIQVANDFLEQGLERAATSEELADYLGVNAEDIETQLANRYRQVSLDKPISEEDSGGTMMDSLATPDGVNGFEKTCKDRSLETELERSMQVLNNKQKDVIYSFFGIRTGTPVGLDEIARQHDLTPERIRQIRDKAIMLLRTQTNTTLLRGFLGS